MAKERSVDEYLGFVKKAVAENDEAPARVSAPASDSGAYEDSWYQVLKAKAEEESDQD